MRTTVKLAVAALCTAILAVPTAHAAGTLAPVQVFEDDTLDSVLLAEATPEAQDLIAGYIGETDDALTFTWQVVDIPDGTGGVPEIIHYYWEFTLDVPDDDKDPQAFSLRARAYTPEVGRGGGNLQGNCTTTGETLVQCEDIPGAEVTVSVDDIENTITASVRRQDLKAGDVTVAVDGAVLDEVDLFQGIATYVGAGLISGNAADLADMDSPYVLGSPRT
ncbi:MAG: hypothetical protein WDA27_00545 [Actinomycetota bacterium]